MPAGEVIAIEYMCSRCGKKQRMKVGFGKPVPGKCPRNSDNRHMWVENKKYYANGNDPELDYTHVEYMCRHCGKRQNMKPNFGKPAPGVCPRRENDLPHSWVINRKY